MSQSSSLLEVSLLLGHLGKRRVVVLRKGGAMLE